MAWNIPQELMNNNPLDKKIVKDRLIKKGYIPVNNGINLIRLKNRLFNNSKTYKNVLSKALLN